MASKQIGYLFCPNNFGRHFWKFWTWCKLTWFAFAVNETHFFGRESQVKTSNDGIVPWGPNSAQLGEIWKKLNKAWTFVEIYVRIKQICESLSPQWIFHRKFEISTYSENKLSIWQKLFRAKCLFPI